MWDWIGDDWKGRIGAVTGVIGSVAGIYASVANWRLSKAVTERRKPVVRLIATAFVKHPGWHQIEMTIWNYAEAPVRIEDVTISGPRGVRLLDQAHGESPDGFGHTKPDPDRMLREKAQRTVQVGFEIAQATGGGNPHRFTTMIYAHSPSPDRPTFRLRCSFSWSDRMTRRFVIAIKTKQPI